MIGSRTIRHFMDIVGMAATGQLGSGTANINTTLRGDNHWAPPFSGMNSSNTLNSTPINDWVPVNGVSPINRIINEFGDITITGMMAGVDCQLGFIINTSTHNITLAHQDTGSSPINRFFNQSGSGLILTPNGGALCLYDNASMFWRIFPM